MSGSVITNPRPMKPMPELHAQVETGRVFARAEANAAPLVADAPAQEPGSNASDGREEAIDRDTLISISHELRTPLNGILATVELLGRTALDDQQRRLLGALGSSAKLMVTTLDGLKPEPATEAPVGTPASKPEPTDLESLKETITNFNVCTCVEGVAISHLAAARARRLDVSVFVGSNVPQTVDGNEAALKASLSQLFQHVISATHEGAVQISALPGRSRSNACSVRFIVRDAGHGAVPAGPDGALDTIGAVTPDYLAAARQHIRQLGGTLAASSTPNGRTSFELEATFTFSGIQQKNSSQPDFSGNRILVASNSETERQIIANYLSAHGAEICSAASGWEAVELVRETAREGSPFAILITDVDTQWRDRETDFLAVLQDAAGGGPQPGLAILSWDSDGGEVADEATGEFALISKPIRREKIVGAANQLMLGFARRLHHASNQDWTAPVHRPPQATWGRVAVRPKDPICAHVLIAEEIIINQEVMREHLEELGCTIEIASNGLEAVRAFEVGRFDVILMDCQMPEMDGLTATHEIRKIEREFGRKRTPIIGVSAHVFESERAKFLGGNSMDDFLCKPYTLDQLEGSMKNALAKDRERKQAANV